MLYYNFLEPPSKIYFGVTGKDSNEGEYITFELLKTFVDSSFIIPASWRHIEILVVEVSRVSFEVWPPLGCFNVFISLVSHTDPP